MAWPKGKPRPAGAGRQKGSANKTTRAVKDMVAGALEQAGGQNYLLMQAELNPVAFMTLIGKLIPSEVKQELTGKDGGAIETNNAHTHGISPADRDFLQRLANKQGDMGSEAVPSTD